jgi:hypothetical protein
MSKSAGKLYAFPNAGDGPTEQWELDTSGSSIRGRKIRGPWHVGSKIEGCVADDATGKLYIVEEMVGIWEYGAGPTDPTTARVQVDRNGAGGHLDDVESLAIAGNVLIASSQGDSSLVTYDTRTRAFIRKFRVIGGSMADGCESPEGIEAIPGKLDATFANGLFVCKDASNTPPGSSGNENFKYVRLEHVVDMPPAANSPGTAQSATRVAAVATRRRISIREVRRRGLRVSVQVESSPGADVRVARIRLEATAGGRRRVLTTAYRTLTSSRASFRLALRSAWLRHALRPARYAFEVALGPSRERLQRPVKRAFTIVR